MPDFRNDGANPLSYGGVRASTPAQMVVMRRAPTQNDVIGYVLGTQWLYWNSADPSQSVQYVLSSVAQNTAVWLPLHGSGDQPDLPEYSVALGTGVPGLDSVSPIATLGAPLISNGTSANPSFGVASVSGGGTGLNDCDPYAVYCGGTTGEGPLQQVSGLGSAGQVLTSNGAGMLPTWQSGSGGSAGGPIAIQVFTSGSGNYVPTSGMGSCLVEIIGGGAGGQTATGGIVGGAGGGAGGYSRKLYTAAQIGASEPYSVGAGGATDTGGGNTTFSSGGTLITANGGAAAAGITTAGAGGTASGGDLNIAGGAGGIAVQDGFITVSGNFSGFGGSSIYGNGAVGRGNSSGVGNAGVVYGSGGSGGVDLTAAGSQAGGAGAGGVVIVTEYGPYGILPPIAATTVNVIVYDTPGAGTYTPTSGMYQVMVECIGGGGGAPGANVSSSGFTSASNGSGGGAYTKKLYTSAQIGASKPYSVGAAGTGGVPGSAPDFPVGTAGSDTTFGTGGTLITAGGGQPAGAFGTNTVGTGGVASGGILNIDGQNGSAWATISGSVPLIMYGSGGSSGMGYGAGGTFNKSNLDGYAGKLYGGGASGGYIASPYNLTGKNGASGVIIITEYIE